MTVQESIKKLKEEEGYKGCAPLRYTQTGRNTALYVCLKPKAESTNLISSFFYHNKDRGITKGFKQIEQITITKNNSWTRLIAMKFTDKTESSLIYMPSWIRIWKHSNLKPESDCEASQSGSSFTLTCKAQIVQSGIHL